MSSVGWLRLVAILVVITKATGEECRPALLWNVQLSDDYVLSWEPSPEEQCDILHFIVSIAHNVNGTEHLYTVTEQSLDISFLPACESVRIRIVSVSTDNIQGHGIVIHKILPLPADADLTIVAIGVTEESDKLLLDWLLDTKWVDCAKHYRLVVYDENTDIATDTYVQTGSAVITDLVPCASYTIQITPMYNVETHGPIFVMGYSPPRAKLASPRLENLTAGTTSINFIWSLQDSTENRCPLTSLIVDGSPYFNRTFPLSNETDRSSIPIEITGLQPDVIYTLNVAVENFAGVSSPTKIAVQTLGNN